MNTDSYYEMGHCHEQCQDYACNGETENIVYCCVSDGCSDSPKSDVGARIVAEAFVRSADQITPRCGEVTDSVDKVKMLDLERTTLQKIERVQSELGLSLRSLNATIVAALYSKHEKALRLYMWGDGHIILKYPDRVVHYYASYVSGAPFYLSYKLGEGRVQEYIKEFIDTRAVITETLTEGDFSSSKIIQEDSLYVRIKDIEDLQYVLVSSDGFDSFTAGTTDEKLDVFNEFTGFKSLAGDFVQRRMMRFRQDTKTKGNTHYDDISSGAIAFK